MEDTLLKLVASGDTILFWVLATVGALIARLVIAQIGNATAAKYVGRALTEVGDAVLDTAKTYVEAIKKAAADGTLTAEEKAEAKARAIATAKANIGPAGLKRLANILGLDLAGLDKWLGTKVEAAVATLEAKPTAADPR